jgi:hypothetical protein
MAGWYRRSCDKAVRSLERLWGLGADDDEPPTLTERAQHAWGHLFSIAAVTAEALGYKPGFRVESVQVIDVTDTTKTPKGPNHRQYMIMIDVHGDKR